MQNQENEFDIDRIKLYMSLTTEEKFKYLEETATFFHKVKDDKAKEINEILKNKGF